MMNNKYNIGEYIYHVTNGGQKGYILDVAFKLSNESYIYLICWDILTTTWINEEELTNNKPIDF